MSSVINAALWALVALIAVGLGIWLYLNLRARRLDRQVGAFRCWSRPDSQAGWTSGIAHYGTETLTWYRLIDFSRSPRITLPRRTLTVSAPAQRTVDGSLVEVRLEAGEQRLEVAIDPMTYNGLVSWVESGPPVPRV